MTAPVVVDSATSSNGSSVNGTVKLKFSLVLQTLGDDNIVMSNATGSKVTVTVPTTGFQLESVKLSDLVSENPVTIQAQTLVEITMIVRTPNTGLVGFVVVFDAENIA
ncbi:MAG: hypothetical protein ACHQ1H_00795 [Nitrososphaerales archaeon]